ncbi:mavicyanin-like [Asparagus officinalis]|uniref:mavicyanin-like n=1 Tax=Asparagus officinalis TaxID=4686 RepID=UPI00098E6119|nr:mavicyanin-like [Asparagus officinalis]
MAFFVVVVAFLSAFVRNSVAGGVYKVGDDNGWTILNHVNYTKWASSKTFKVGDQIVFIYNKQFHNVLQVSKEDYHSCNPNSPIATYKSGNDTIPIKRKGHYFFICGAPGHCAAGQSVDIRIPKSSVHAASSNPASPPSTLPSSGSPPVTTSVPGPAPDSSKRRLFGQGIVDGGCFRCWCCCGAEFYVCISWGVLWNKILLFW